MRKTDLARKYRLEYGMEMPTLKLARIMYSKESTIFKSVEVARDVLRQIENKKGFKYHNHIKNKEIIMSYPERPRNPYNLPQSYEEKREPFVLPLGCNNILLISDLHIPYHNIEAISLAFDYGLEQKVNTIFINGDLIDNAQVSKFEKDLKKRSVKEEFDLTKDFLRQLRFTFPDAHIYWLKGNHCIRWERFLMQKVSEIWDDPYFHLEERLRLNEERVMLFDDKVLVKAGKLAITHGHHVFKGSSSASPAKNAADKANQHLITSHLHRVSSFYKTNMHGEVIISAWTTGCLCELQPNYQPFTGQAQHGFAHVTVENSGNFTVKNYTIINGQIH